MKNNKRQKPITWVTLVIVIALALYSGIGNFMDGMDAENSAPNNQAPVTQPKDEQSQKPEDEKKPDDAVIAEDKEYSSKDEVALYIHTYDKLPKNYITKKEAQALGWVSKEGNLWDVAPGKSIGGDTFGNREKKLPVESGVKYYECDINYEGGYRGEERIVYSNDGAVYYTKDHYNTFKQLYP